MCLNVIKNWVNVHENYFVFAESLLTGDIWKKALYLVLDIHKGKFSQ